MPKGEVARSAAEAEAIAKSLGMSLQLQSCALFGGPVAPEMDERRGVFLDVICLIVKHYRTEN